MYELEFLHTQLIGYPNLHLTGSYGKQCNNSDQIYYRTSQNVQGENFRGSNKM